MKILNSASSRLAVVLPAPPPQSFQNMSDYYLRRTSSLR